MLLNTSPGKALSSYFDCSKTSLFFKRFDNGYITWVNDDKPTWTIYSGGMAADPLVNISARPIPMEPMACPLLIFMHASY